MPSSLGADDRRLAPLSAHCGARRKVATRMSTRLRSRRPPATPRPPTSQAAPGREAMTLIDERQRRIVTTHVGSLPRPASLSAKLFARMTNQPYDAHSFPAELRDAVRAIVRQQGELGIDVVSDGEFSKISFQYYVTDRLGGNEPVTPKARQRLPRG